MPDRHLHPVTSPWGTDASGYDVNRYYTRSTDRHGHQRHARVNLPPEVMARIEAIIARRVITEYRTSQDLIRDAISHRLHWIEERIDDPELAEALSLERTRGELEQIGLEVGELRGIIEQAEMALALTADTQDWWALSRTIEKATDKVDEVREPYSSKLQELVRKYRREYARQLAGVQ